MSMLEQHIMVDALMVGKRIDQALGEYLTDFSRNQHQAWLLSGEILLDGSMVKPKQKLKIGQLIEIKARISIQTEAKAQDLPLDIVYEDDSMLIINKPAGLVVHPGAGNSEYTLMNALLHHHPQANTLPRAGIVHRLDKDTTGLMVVSKTITSYHALVDAMQRRDIQREYEAIVDGHFISGGTVDAPIGRHPTQRTHMAVRETGKGKPAVTHYRILQQFTTHTHLRLILETGRTHQIRVHMAYLKHPIVGDPIYNRKPTLLIKRQALHAKKLALNHPLTQERLSFETSLPHDMNDLLDHLTRTHD